MAYLFAENKGQVKGMLKKNYVMKPNVKEYRTQKPIIAFHFTVADVYMI